MACRASPESQACSLADLLCCLPQVQAPTDLGYRNVFRVLTMQLIDAQGFDLRAVKKSCVHIVQPDGRIIPFDTFNLSIATTRLLRWRVCGAKSSRAESWRKQSMSEMRLEPPTSAPSPPPPLPPPPDNPESHRGSLAVGVGLAWPG